MRTKANNHCHSPVSTSAARRVAIVFALEVALLGMCSRALAADATQSLAAAEAALAKGQYRIACDALNTLAPSIEQRPMADRLKYWNIRADVELASGQLAEAEQAAQTHLDLLRTVVPRRTPSGSAAERESLVRLAIAKRAWCNEQFDQRPSQEDEQRLEEVCALLMQALEFPATGKPADLMREADTRFQLAETLVWLGRVDRAQDEFAAASNAAVAALEKFDTLPNQEKFGYAYLRGVTIVQRSYVSADEGHAVDDATPVSQAKLAHGIIQKRLRRSDLPRSARVALLAAGADCSRQLKHSASEERQLREALRIADRSVDAEKHACAKISVRLAELSDFGVE